MSSKVESNDVTESVAIKKCIYGITNGIPYDTSVFPNNASTVYTQIGYSHIGFFLKLFSSDESELDLSDPRATSSRAYFMDPEVTIIFRFLCSPECCDGSSFIDASITEIVFNFVRMVCSIRPVIIEFSDHSMGSFFTNWKDEFMGMSSPIEILPLTTCGRFKMSGKKEDFESSVHPTLKQIGDMSSDPVVEITFNNMNGTKVFKVCETSTPVKVISMGCEQITTYQPSRFSLFSLDAPAEESTDVPAEGSLYPVHCEFDYRHGKIVVSATHWCNLDQVENDIDLPTLRRYCTETFGRETTDELDSRLASITSPHEMKRAISTAVRGISSGQPTDKKCKCDDPFC